MREPLADDISSHTQLLQSLSDKEQKLRTQLAQNSEEDKRLEELKREYQRLKA